MAGLGLALDAEVPHVAYVTESVADGTTKAVDLGPGLIPPAVLIPRLRGEPVRAEFAWPGHPRGSGEAWPPEARCDPATGSGRFPLAYAWAMLSDRGQHGAPWQWGDSAVRPAEAISCAATSLLSNIGGLPDDIDPVLVIPNHLRSGVQQELIDGARRYGIRVRLLWRPVAAAMAWCRYNREKLLQLEGDQDGVLGRVLAIHAGLGCFEATSLEIVRRYDEDNRPCLLPARGRPRSMPLIGFGLSAVEELACGTARSLGRRETAWPWQALWATTWLPWVLDVLRDGSQRNERRGAPATLGLPADAGESSKATWSEAYGAHFMSEPTWLAAVASAVPARPNAQSVKNWIESDLRPSGEDGDGLLGAVITGPLAGVLYDGRPVGRLLVDKLKCQPDQVLCESIDLPKGVLAHMAAVHSARLHRGMPTYLDTLPRIKMIVTKLGEPTWEDLLEDEDRYVDGGRMWTRSGVGKGQMAIARDSDELPVDLNHDEFDTVRTVSSKLSAESDSRIPLSLSVSIMPAQGNARIEVVPDEEGALGRSRLLMDWAAMKDTEESPEEFLDSIERICPRVTVRRQSWDRWRHVRWLIQSLVRSGRGIDSSLPKLDEIRLALQQPEMGSASYALGSAGTVAVGGEDLEAFVDRLVDHLLQHPVGSAAEGSVYRCLAHVFTADPRFQGILAKEIAGPLDPPRLMAIGRCLRDTRSIALFARVFCRRLKQSHDRVGNWLRAFSELVKFREAALEHVPSKLCLEVTGHLLSIFDSTFTSKRMLSPIIFRHSCVGVVYLLRRRAYDNGYLSPDSCLAKGGKLLFKKALDLAERGVIHLPGGMVNLRAELPKLIDYIDRKGRGSIEMAAID